MIPALILFAVTYVLMLVFSKYRPYIALASALVFIVTGMLPLGEILPAIDWNVILMIAGTMGLVALFIESKMPELLADLVMEKVPNVQWAAVALSLFAGVISAFVDNVATVLMIAPVAMEICKKLKTIPFPSSSVSLFPPTFRALPRWLATPLPSCWAPRWICPSWTSSGIRASPPSSSRWSWALCCPR